MFAKTRMALIVIRTSLEVCLRFNGRRVVRVRPARGGDRPMHNVFRQLMWFPRIFWRDVWLYSIRPQANGAACLNASPLRRDSGGTRQVGDPFTSPAPARRDDLHCFARMLISPCSTDSYILETMWSDLSFNGVKPNSVSNVLALGEQSPGEANALRMKLQYGF